MHIFAVFLFYLIKSLQVMETFKYEPLAGMDLEKANATRGYGGGVEQFAAVELGKASATVADDFIDQLLLGTVRAVRERELNTYIDSFGTNHSLENSAIALAAAYQIWDKDDYHTDVEQELIEPVPAPLDVAAEARVRRPEAFDADNMVDTQFV